MTEKRAHNRAKQQAKPGQNGVSGRNRPLHPLHFAALAVVNNLPEFLATFVMSLLATASQMALAFLAFRLIAQPGQPLSPFGTVLPPLAVWGGLAMLAMSAAILPYLTERMIIARTLAFFRKSRHRFSEAISDRTTRFALFLNGYDRGSIVRLMVADCRYASLAYAGLLRSVMPLMMAIGALIVLAVLDPLWTAVLALLLSPFLILQVRVLVSGIALNRELRASAQENARNISAFVGAISTHFVANRRGQDDLSEVFRSQVGERFLSAYGARLKLGVSLRLMSDLSMVAMIVAATVLLLTNPDGVELLAKLIVFGIVARYAAGNASTFVSGLIATVSQLPFYENYRRAEGLLSRFSAEQLTDPKPAAAPSATRIALYTPQPLSWPLIYQYLSTVRGERSALRFGRGAQMVDGKFLPIDRNFVTALQLPVGLDERRFVTMFPASAHRFSEYEKAVSLLTDNFHDSAWRSIPSSIKFLASARYAARGQRSPRYVFINGQDAAGLTREEKNWLASLFLEDHAVYTFRAPIYNASLPHFAELQTLSYDEILNILEPSSDIPEIQARLRAFFESEKDSGKLRPAGDDSFDATLIE